MQKDTIEKAAEKALDSWSKVPQSLDGQTMYDFWLAAFVAGVKWARMGKK